MKQTVKYAVLLDLDGHFNILNLSSKSKNKINNFKKTILTNSDVSLFDAPEYVIDWLNDENDTDKSHFMLSELESRGLLEILEDTI